MAPYTGLSPDAPSPHAAASLGFRALAVLGCFIFSGLGLAFAITVIWPTLAGVLTAASLIAGTSATGGYATAALGADPGATSMVPARDSAGNLTYRCIHEFPDRSRCIYGSRHGGGFHLSPTGERKQFARSDLPAGQEKTA